MKIAFLSSILLLTINSLWAQNNIEHYSIPQLDTLAQESYFSGDVEKANYYWTIAVEKAKAIAMDSTYASLINNLGITIEEMGDLDQAEALYKEAAALTTTLYNKQHISYIESINNLGYLYRYKGDRKKAVLFQEEALLLGKKVLGAEHPKYAELISNLATSYQEISKFEEAETLYLEGLKIERKILGINHPDYAASIHNLAALYSTIGQYQEAETMYLEALKIRKATLGPKHPLYALNLYNLASLYQKINRLEEAEPLLIEAINIDKKNKNLNYAISIGKLAGLYTALGKFNKGEGLYLEARDIAKEIVGTEHPKYADILSSLSVNYLKTKQYEKAETALKEVLKIYIKKTGENSLSTAAVLNNLGAFYTQTQKYDEAIPIYIKAYTIYSHLLGENHPRTLKALNFLFKISIQKSNFEQATKYANRVIYHNCKQKNIDLASIEQLDSIAIHLVKESMHEFYASEVMIITLDYVAKMYHAIYDKNNDLEALKKAYELMQLTLEINEQIRNNFSGEENKLRSFQDMSILLYSSIKYGQLLNNLEPKNPSYVSDIFYFLEQNKSVLLLDALKGTKAKSMGTLPDSLVTQELTLQEEKDNLQKKLALAKTDEENAQLRVKQNELNLKTKNFLALLKEKHPKYHELKYDNITASIEDVQGALETNTVLLEYFVSESSVFLLELTKETSKVHKIPIEKDSLSQQIKVLRDALSNYSFILKHQKESYSIYNQTAYWFYEKLLKEALIDKKAERLIIITDGELGHLPFEVFLTKPSKQGSNDYSKLHYLINDYDISYNYSATLWKENLLGKSKNNNSEILAIGADYSKVDSSLFDLRDIYASNLRSHLKPLPAVKEEINVLSEQFKGLFLQEQQANESTFKTKSKDYAIVHLAMHGILNTNKPMLSSLAFTEDLDSIEDNFLQAYEISRLELNADLVVLSACETGYGKFQQGEGVLSLARSFMYAQVPSLVVSLWQVNDASTAIIMTDFYKNIANGMAKDAALRQAKLDYIKSSKGITTHPAFWSPFIQMGNTEAIYLKRKGSGILGWAIIGVALLAMGGLILLRRKKQS